MNVMIERALQRRCAPLAALAVTMVYLAFGGLHPIWALVGLAGTTIWALLWRQWPYGLRSKPTALQDARATQEGASTANRLLPISMLDGLPDAALVLDDAGLILAANAAARAISPVTEGGSISQWMRAPELLAAVAEASRSAAQHGCQLRWLTPVERLFHMLVTPLAGSNAGGRGSVLVILRDLTEQEHISRMRADFVANASHELRTPLASIRGFVETLLGAAKDDPEARARFLPIMQMQAERMSRLIDDLLTLSRIEMREHIAPTGSVDVADVVHEVLAPLQPDAAAAGIAIRVAGGKGPRWAVGDRDEIAQVAQNLIQNAVKYGHPGGTVAIDIKREGALLLLEVTDDGIGIAPEHVPRLTERFYRVSAKESNSRGGTGLGLAIVKHIVNRHRGELRISSTLGKGSTFAVALPATTAVAAHSEN